MCYTQIHTRTHTLPGCLLLLVVVQALTCMEFDFYSFSIYHSHILAQTHTPTHKCTNAHTNNPLLNKVNKRFLQYLTTTIAANTAAATATTKKHFNHILFLTLLAVAACPATVHMSLLVYVFVGLHLSMPMPMNE